MKNFKLLPAIIALGTIIISSYSNAQDYHFSQFDALVPTYQPALTGMFSEYTYRGATQYRNQWRPLANKPFSTYALSYDMPINARWGVGGYLVNYDGARVFNSFNFAGSVAYQITDVSQREHLLTTGLQIGLIYKNTNNADLLFDSQYSEGAFSPEISSNETFQRFSKLLPEFNAGIYYEWTDRSNDYHPYVGATIFHASSPKENLLDTDFDSRLPRRYLFHGGSKFQLTGELDADVKLMYQLQGKASEFVTGFLGSYSMQEQYIDLKLGFYYRHKDAVIITAGVDYEDLMFLISYDLTISGLNDFNNGFGALEFTLAYRPRK